MQDDKGDYIHIENGLYQKINGGEIPKRASKPTIHQGEAFENKIAFNVKPCAKDKGKRKAKGDWQCSTRYVVYYL